jgi:hypothetical protein
MSKTAAVGGTFGPGEFYTLHEFSQKCGLTVRTVRERFVNSGLLRVTTLGRSSAVVSYDEVARFFREHEGDAEWADDQT